MFYIIDYRFTENEIYTKTNIMTNSKVDVFWQLFHYQLSGNFTSRQNTSQKHRVMIKEPVNYIYMYVFSPGDSVASIMTDAVCKFYKEKFQIKKLSWERISELQYIVILKPRDKNFDGWWTKNNFPKIVTF